MRCLNTYCKVKIEWNKNISIQAINVLMYIKIIIFSDSDVIWLLSIYIVNNNLCNSNISPVVVIRIDTDLFSSKMEGVLAMLHRFEFMMVDKVWVAPQSAVDNMRQSLLGSNLQLVNNINWYPSTLIIGLRVIGQKIWKFWIEAKIHIIFHWWLTTPWYYCVNNYTLSCEKIKQPRPCRLRW